MHVSINSVMKNNFVVYLWLFLLVLFGFSEYFGVVVLVLFSIIASHCCLEKDEQIEISVMEKRTSRYYKLYSQIR